MIELTPKSEISELIKPDPIKPAEETTPTYDLLEQVREHEEFGLEDGVLILEDKGLKLEHIRPYPWRITGKFRVSCEDPLIEISGLGETEKPSKSHTAKLSNRIATFQGCRRIL